ncbi:DUF6969 family protein [Acidiphilium sp.]|uniref:DUF6969 family protein n=1 Tax=Acidiphilium sp. TaxID=527 RepID=UPI003D06C872
MDARRAGDEIVAQILAWAEARQSAPARVVGDTAHFVEWAHYPQPDAIDPTSRWRFYYHAHPESQRLRREHGHFHIFVPAPPEPTAETAGGFSHLVALSVDAQGLPLRLFTTNRWVTDEVWQPASAMIRYLDSPALHDAAPEDVARWLNHIVIRYAGEIEALLVARDIRMAAAAHRHPHALEDHRLRIPSQRAIRLT